MQTLSISPWQQSKCLHSQGGSSFLLARIWFLWQWSRHFCVWASGAVSVLMLCTVQEHVHIWLWFNNTHTCRDAAGISSVSNWGFDQCLAFKVVVGALIGCLHLYFVSFLFPGLGWEFIIITKCLNRLYAPTQIVTFVLSSLRGIVRFVF